jgi:hypothetical protein
MDKEEKAEKTSNFFNVFQYYITIKYTLTATYYNYYYFIIVRESFAIKIQ